MNNLTYLDDGIWISLQYSFQYLSDKICLYQRKLILINSDFSNFYTISNYVKDAYITEWVLWIEASVKTTPASSLN